MAEVIATVGFALQAYTSIIEIYNLLKKIHGLDKDAPVLLWKLRMQQVRFEVFGKHWGLDKPGFSTFIEEEGFLEVVTITLKNIKQLFDDGNQLDKLYGVQISNNNAENSVKKSTGIDKLNIAGKFRWALRDKGKFEKLIQDLKEHNDNLHALLRLRESTMLEKLAQSMLLQGVTNLETSRHLAEASRETSTIETQPVPQVRRRHDLILNRELRKSLETKSYLLEQQSFNTDDIVSAGRSMLLDHKSIRYAPLNSPSDVRLVAEINLSDADIDQIPTQAIIDWRDTNIDEPLRGKVLKRLDKLAYLLSSRISKPEDLRVLECLGYFEDPYSRRHGFVHRIPEGSESRAPINLYELMARQHDQVPDLNDRFVLARALAISVLRLHDCGWLHTSFRSSNVVFFHTRNQGQVSTNAPWRSIDFSQPYLVGFSYAKPTSLEEVTLEQSKSTLEHSLYRDPVLVIQDTKTIEGLEKARTRQQMRHDYYSLGIVLLEIGLWDQITTLWKSKYTRSAFLEKLLNAYVPKLGPKMGAIYRDVVHRLLIGTIGAVSDEIEVVNAGDMIESSTNNISDWTIATQLLKCSA